MDYGKYKEALDKAKVFKKHLLENNEKVYANEMDYIFPELKKEGENKRIIKILQNIVKGACSKYGIKYIGAETCEEDLLAWLEKQGEQKSSNKVVSKFNIGDWIVKKDGISFYNGMRAVQITNIDGWGRCWFDYSTRISTKEIRLWTLKDARDGDVLVDNKRPFIFKGFLDISNPNHLVAYCGINTLGSFISGSGSNWWTNNKDDVKPATKEERELLYREMEKDGYEWNKITKELKKKSS